MRRLLFLIVLGLAFCLAESSAQGGFVLYTNRADFDAATHGRTTIDFENIADDGKSIGGQRMPSITILPSGITFSTTADGGLTVAGRNVIAPGSSSVLYMQASLADPDLVATLPGSFTAFGVDFGVSREPAPQTEVTFTLSTGYTFTLTTTNDSFTSLTFIGLVSTDSFNSVTMSIPEPISNFDELDIDNFTFGSGLAVVPAPSSGVLMVIGLATILGYAARPSRRVAASA